MTDPLARVLAAEEAAARELATIPSWLWDGDSVPVPVESIADNHYGLLVREGEDLAGRVNLPDSPRVSGLLFPLLREIWVDAEEAERAPVRRRFTIGHELGHWVLHCRARAGDATDVVHCRAELVQEAEGPEPDDVREEKPRPRWSPLGLSYYPPPELDANQFGAALLMPRALVEGEHAWLAGSVARTARAFGVSELAMEKRLWFLRKYPPASA